MLRDQGAEGMADHMGATNSEMNGGVLDRFNQKRDSDLLRRRRRAAGAGQIRTDDAKA